MVACEFPNCKKTAAYGSRESHNIRFCNMYKLEGMVWLLTVERKKVAPVAGFAAKIAAEKVPKNRPHSK